MTVQENCEGNRMTCWLVIFVLDLSVARWSSTGQGVQRPGQELMCEEWAWKDQLLEANFKPD